MIKDLLSQVAGWLQEQFNPQLKSPVPQQTVVPQAEAQAPTTTRELTRQYRHPIYDNPRRSSSGLKMDEMLSGTQLASEETGVPQDLLMDIPAIESSGGQFLTQMSGGPGRGPYQFEMPLPPDLAAIAGENFDPNSATESASLAAKLIKDKQLRRWGKMGGSWGSVDNQKKDPKDRLTNYYTDDELARFLR